MDAVWSRFLKLNSLLLLSSLPIIQRLVNGIQQNLQSRSRQQQVKMSYHLVKTAFSLLMIVIYLSNVMVPKHVSAASSSIAEDYSNNSQII